MQRKNHLYSIWEELFSSENKWTDEKMRFEMNKLNARTMQQQPGHFDTWDRISKNSQDFSIHHRLHLPSF